MLLQALGAGKFDDLDAALPDDEDIDIVNDETFGAGAVCKYICINKLPFVEFPPTLVKSLFVHLILIYC